MTAGAPPPGHERRIATALFADVSGFTGLATSLPPDELSRVIDPLLASLTDVVVAYGGRLEKYAGDALLALFGTDDAHDDDAQRALRCALEMHAAVAAMTHHPLVPGLSLHIGIDTGPVLMRAVGAEEVGQVGALGEAVVVAQRLFSNAPAGQTYVGRATVDLAGPAYEFEPLGPMVVKGRREPLEVHRLLDVADRIGHRGRSRMPLAGRHAERAAIAEAVRALEVGRGSALVVAGEAGSGKTRLVEELVAAAEAAGIPTLVGSSASFALATPYQPLLPWWRPWPGERVDPALAALGGSGVDGADPEARRARVRAAAVELLRSRAADRGLVAVVEDLHWADDATRDLLGVLAAYAASDRVLLVVTSRSVAAAVESLTVAGADTPRVLDLPPLDPPRVAELAGDLLGGPVDARVRDAVAERSQGNPLFAAELVLALRERGDVQRAEGRWRLRAGLAAADLPLTVETVLAGQVDALPRDLREVLVTVSIVGDRVSPRRAAVVLEMPVDLARVNLERLVDAGLLVPSGEDYAFRHVLVREAARDRLPERRARGVHVLAAEAAVLLGGPPERVTAALAYHLYLAGAPRLALPHLRAAAASARAVFASADAEVALSRAAEAAAREPVDPSLPDVLLQLAEVRQLQGHNEIAAETFAAAASAGAGTTAVAGQAGALRRAGDYEAALAVLAAGAGGSADDDTRLLDLERSWVLGLMGRRAEARAAAHHGLARPGADDEVTGRLLLQLVWVLMVDGELDAARRSAERALPLVRGDARSTVTAYRLLGDIAHRDGDIETARGVLALGLAEARRTGNVEEEAACLLNLGLAVSAAGDHAEAAACYDQALEAFTVAANPVGRSIAHGNRAWERMHLDDLDGAEADAQESLRLSRATANTLAQADVTNTLALVARRRGAVDLAKRLAHEAADLFGAAGARDEAAAAEALARELDDDRRPS